MPSAGRSIKSILKSSQWPPQCPYGAERLSSLIPNVVNINLGGHLNACSGLFSFPCAGSLWDLSLPSEEVRRIRKEK